MVLRQRFNEHCLGISRETSDGFISVLTIELSLPAAMFILSKSLFTLHADSFMIPAMLDCHIVKEHQVHTYLTAEENEA